ncbi:hypothetical protein MSKU3_3324 [Komagataeibacter oboediens]|nr:hypothetical protein MSKU3_3324 [Komagataeibacter oboediens]
MVRTVGFHHAEMSTEVATPSSTSHCRASEQMSSISRGMARVPTLTARRSCHRREPMGRSAKASPHQPRRSAEAAPVGPVGDWMPTAVSSDVGCCGATRSVKSETMTADFRGLSNARSPDTMGQSPRAMRTFQVMAISIFLSFKESIMGKTSPTNIHGNKLVSGQVYYMKRWIGTSTYPGFTFCVVRFVDYYDNTLPSPHVTKNIGDMKDFVPGRHTCKVLVSPGPERFSIPVTLNVDSGGYIWELGGDRITFDEI